MNEGMIEQFKLFDYQNFLKNDNNKNEYINFIKPCAHVYNNMSELSHLFYSKLPSKNVDIIYNYYNFIKDKSHKDVIYWGDRYFNDPSKPVETYFNMFEYFVVNNILNFENSIGLDFGSGLGFSTINFSLFNPKKIYGCDYRDKQINSDFVNSFLSYNKSTLEYEYIQNNTEDIIFNSGLNNLDWITMYDVLSCIPRVDGYSYHINLCNYLNFAYNILKKNGILFIGCWEQDNLYIHKSDCLKGNKGYNKELNNGHKSAGNFNHLSVQSEVCKILEIIGFSKINLYHNGFGTNTRYYIVCYK